MVNALDRARTTEVRELVRTAQYERAEALLDQWLETRASNPEHLYLRGMLHARRGENRWALQRFDEALHLVPDVPPLLFNRGLILYRLERTEEALEDFLRLGSIEPDNADVWINAGIIQLRADRHGEALQSLHRAARLRPDSLLVMRLIANTMREMGNLSDSIMMHREVVSRAPDDPAALTDFALGLVALRDYENARINYLRALRIDPADQTALAGLYMTGSQLEDAAQVEQLMDYRALLHRTEAGKSGEQDLAALRELLLSLRNLAMEPAGRSTKQGRQSPLLNLDEHPQLRRFESTMSELVEQRIGQLAADRKLRAHPWLAALPTRWRVQSWVTILEQGGRQTPHIHPAGWMSGVFYVDTGQPHDPASGNLVFGQLRNDLPLERLGREARIRPVAGELVMFPSYFFHNTTPHAGDDVRISLAFDVVRT